MPLTFVRAIGHRGDAYLFIMKDGAQEIECAITNSALQHSLINRSHVTDADRESAFQENKERIIRIASTKYDVGITQADDLRVLITFEDYSTRQYP